MRAAVYEKYGSPSVLHLSELDRPTPTSDEVLIRVVSSTVNRTDCGFRTAKPFIVRFYSGLLRPKVRVLGSEFAGVVESVGRDVTEFSVGDEVFGLRSGTFGTHAEYVCIRAGGLLVKMPTNLTFGEAAAVCDGALLALMLLRASDLKSGQKVLINGASGSIGTAAVQLAKQFDVHVTAVCGTPNVELVRSLGAHEVIDYLQVDFTTLGHIYDVIIDAVGKERFRRCRRVLKRGGLMVETDLGFMWQNPILALLTKFGGSRKLRFPIPDYRTARSDLIYLKSLIESGHYRPVIDRRYPLEQIVEATSYVETEQKVGNVVIDVGASQ
jgi:NADPH:quinone reductase-like Zn-dependent oxidoreductase